MPIPLSPAAQQLFGPFPPCRHCNERPAAPYKRGLCRRCYRDRSTRDQYPRIKFKTYNQAEEEEEEEDTGPLPLPDEPTSAIPGTLEKQRVMMARLAAGKCPHHPLDARMDQDRVVRVPVTNFWGKVVGWKAVAVVAS